MKNILIASALACACMSTGYAAPMSAAREAEIEAQLAELQKLNIQIVELLRGVTSKETATRSAPQFDELMTRFVKGGGDSDYKMLLAGSQFEVMKERRNELLRIMRVNGFDSQPFIDVWNKHIREVSLRPAPPEPQAATQSGQHAECKAQIDRLRAELETQKRKIDALNEQLREKNEQVKLLSGSLTQIQSDITFITHIFIQHIHKYTVVKTDSDALNYLNAAEDILNTLNKASALLESVVDKDSADAVAAQLQQTFDAFRAAGQKCAQLEKKYPDTSRRISALIEPIVKAATQRLSKVLIKVGEKNFYNSEALKNAVISMAKQ